MAGAADRYFTPEAVNSLRRAIAEASGNEVFFLGATDPTARVVSVRVLARGNRDSAPAIVEVPRPGEVVIHNHPSGRLQPSEADIHVASLLGNQGVGFLIVDNGVERVYAVVEPSVPRTRERLDIQELRRLLAPGGAVARALPGFEAREGQVQMLEAVTAAFNDDEVLTVEAGTGTGKSLAYLLPAILWATRNGERVIVSTHTINLQEQLVGKDLPLLTERAGLSASVALVKGRGNYLCQRKAAQVEAQGAQLVDDELSQELRGLIEWAKKTRDGSLADLPVRPSPAAWEQVVSENDNCLRVRCPYYSKCFFYESRRAAARADVVVVNHHLLLADLSLREELGSYEQNAVLPPARRVIVDEAHHLDDVATSYFGERIGASAIERILGRLRSQRHENRGLLLALRAALREETRGSLRELAEGALRRIDRDLLPGHASLLVRVRDSFLELAEAYEKHLGRPLPSEGEDKVRLTDELLGSSFWAQSEARLPAIADGCAQLAGALEGVAGRIDRMGEEAGRQLVFLNTELRAMQTRLAGMAERIASFLSAGDESCRWVSARTHPRRGPEVAFESAPVRVGPKLRTVLFEPFPTVVLTSATLAVGRSFAYLHRNVGLEDLEPPERVRTLQVPSPFDYERQALLAIPADLPQPGRPGYEEATHEVIAGAARAAGGGTFALFTSYSALQRAAAAVGPALESEGFTVLRQGEANRHHLLQRFVAARKAILFGTDSFWEGVDVRGEALRCVIIARLPFRVPTEPIEQARVEAIERTGGNPFRDHSLPQAVLKLKQGFGRLIRSREDRGAVVLLDSRVVGKSYGNTFLSSLPPARRLIAGRREVLAALRQLFGRSEF